jgi:hypothetical protein
MIRGMIFLTSTINKVNEAIDITMVVKASGVTLRPYFTTSICFFSLKKKMKQISTATAI